MISCTSLFQKKKGKKTVDATTQIKHNAPLFNFLNLLSPNILIFNEISVDLLTGKWVSGKELGTLISDILKLKLNLTVRNLPQTIIHKKLNVSGPGKHNLHLQQLFSPLHICPNHFGFPTSWKPQLSLQLLRWYCPFYFWPL